MKKVLVMALSAVMIMTVVGCSKNNNELGDKEAINKVENNEKTNNIMLFGKVKSIVGNEIELELAENQEGNNEEDDDNKDEVIDELGLGASMSDMGSDEVDGPSSEGGGSGESAELIEGDQNKIELKYTGEVIKLSIPTGTIIMDVRSNNESKLTSIKKGAVIRVHGSGAKEALKISNIEIVE